MRPHCSPLLLLWALAAALAVACNAFDSSEIRLLEEGGNKRDELGGPYAKRTQQFASGAPLIRFGRSPMHTRQARTQQRMMDPLIRFGKRSGAPAFAAGGAPLIRFGKRLSGPIIRFGKRSPAYPFASSEAYASSEAEYPSYFEQVADGTYARFQRNPRPNPVDQDDTMLRFG